MEDDMGIMLEPYDGSSRDEMVALIEQDNPYMACQQSYANQFIQAPPSLDHRYMHEDIGSGLLPIAELGHLAGVRGAGSIWVAFRRH